MRAGDVHSDPGTAREVWRLLQEGKRFVGALAGPDPVPFGIAVNRSSLELIAEYAYQQQLIPRRISVDEMFAETAEFVDL